MDKLIMIGYEASTMLIPFFVTLILFHRIYGKNRVKRSTVHLLFIIIFAVYICAVFYFTGTGTLYDLLLRGLKISPEQFNLLPFMDDDIDIIAYLQNILLFIPLGLFLPVLWKKFRKIGYTIMTGFSFSLLIETSQLLNNRRTDIDDLILNTLGTVIGFFVSLLFCKIFRSFRTSQKYYALEPVIYILVMFAGRFFLFHEIGLAKILYQF